MGRSIYRTAIERFMSHILPHTDNECWLWNGYIEKYGRGRFWPGSDYNKGQKMLAYVYSYEMFIGPRDKILTINHICGNKLCVNPDHLEQIPIRDNVLQSEGITAINARKTHCKRGHEFTPANTYKNGGGRGCLTCRRNYWLYSQLEGRR